MEIVKVKSLSLLLWFSGLLVTVASAQDRVILHNGDTLRCNIYRETKTALFFKQHSNGISSKGKIAKTEVAEWTYRSTDADTMPAKPEATSGFVHQEPPVNPFFEAETKTQHLLRFSLKTGFGLLIGNTDKTVQDMENMGIPKDDADAYANDLLLGYNGNFAAHYSLSERYWLGLHYNGFYTQAKRFTRSFSGDDDYWIYGEIGERSYVNFAGASFYSKSLFGPEKRLGIYSSYSIGPVLYRNEVEYMRQQSLLTGISLGQNLDLGFEYFIQPRWAISLEASVFAARLRKIKVKTSDLTQTVELEKENYNNLSRVELAFGVVFYW